MTLALVLILTMTKPELKIWSIDHDNHGTETRISFLIIIKDRNPGTRSRIVFGKKESNTNLQSASSFWYFHS